MTARYVVASLALVTVGCGGAHMSAPDAAAFSSLANEVTARAQDHRVRMEQAGAAGCSAEMARYAGDVAPLVDRMAGMSRDMDACMNAMGHTESADMQATCGQMRQELDAHVASTCAAADPVSETARHVEAMQQMAAHERDRASTMGTMMGGTGGMMSGACSM